MNKKTNKFLALFLAFIMVFASPLQTIIYANYGPPDSAYEQEKQEEDSSYISDFYDDEESEDGNLYEKPEDIDSDQFPPDLESDDLTNQLKGIQVNIT
ncbi:MAG: hypothetical protein FWE02_06305, partial [Defluviitaleaceae bacterium]|nr:hypothetical protein [Defluviitaleaceae bacterium]